MLSKDRVKAVKTKSRTKTAKGNKEVQVLRRIRTRLAKHWTQGYLAKDDEGRDVESLDPAARKWCMLGAIEKECLESGYAESSLIEKLQSLLSESVSDSCYTCTPEDYQEEIISFNDYEDTTRDAVLARVDKAIQKAQQ